MPLPLAPVAVFAVRIGAVAAAAWAVRRAVARATRAGRTDQRAEDALDDMEEGLTTHLPADRTGQRNAALRLRRVIRWRARAVEIDLGLLARLRVREVPGKAPDDRTGGAPT